MNEFKTKDYVTAASLYYFSPHDYIGYELGDNGKKHIVFIFDHAGSQEQTLLDLNREQFEPNMNWYRFKSANDFIRSQIKSAKKMYNL